jgi:3-oxoacyl-[acyl-carrier-protein] synthase II
MGGPFVITGTGLVSAAGDTPQAVLAALWAGVPLRSPPADDRLTVAAIEQFDAKRYIPKKGVKDLSRLSQLACSATAANARGLDGVAADEVGLVLGSAWGAERTVIDFEREAHLQGARFVDPILFTETVSNVPAGQVAILHGWSAFNATVSAGSASGLAAIRQALAFLEEGRGSAAVAGGADELNRPALRALDRDAAGVVGGEGACFLTIESESHAAGRGARSLATIRATDGAFVPGAARSPGVARASMTALVRRLLTRAGMSSSEVQLVVLSADGSPDGGADESGAVRDVFGEAGSAPTVLAPKAILGETWGASGAFAAAVAIEALRPMRSALILDRTDSGHQLGLILSVTGSHES